MTASTAGTGPFEPPTATLPRRLGAMLYDALLIVALWMVVTAILLPLTGGEAITPRSVGWLEGLYQLLLVSVVVFFFGYSWTRTGQTVGMAAWRLKLVRAEGGLPSWRDTLRRLAAALISAAAFGLGYVWVVFDRDRLAWHDRFSGTKVVLLPKRR
ncbi:MAG TPA: RDD family protein [Steroidobacteraceae bacterium]|nr:RDD family protein [Steroidobacteraceae bacterium]